METFTKTDSEILVEIGKKQKTVAPNICCHFLVVNPPAHLKNNNARDDQTYLHQNGNGSQSQFFLAIVLMLLLAGVPLVNFREKFIL